VIPDELSHGLPVGLVLSALPREQNHAQALPAPARLHRTQRIKNPARKEEIRFRIDLLELPDSTLNQSPSQYLFRHFGQSGSSFCINKNKYKKYFFPYKKVVF
jgi:hypothetical protein